MGTRENGGKGSTGRAQTNRVAQERPSQPEPFLSGTSPQIRGLESLHQGARVASRDRGGASNTLS